MFLWRVHPGMCALTLERQNSHVMVLPRLHHGRGPHHSETALSKLQRYYDRQAGRQAGSQAVRQWQVPDIIKGRTGRKTWVWRSSATVEGFLPFLSR